MPSDQMALRFVRTHDFAAVGLHRFEQAANFLKIDPKPIPKEVGMVIARALDLWPAAAPELLGEARAATILGRLETLPLVLEAREKHP